MKSNIQGIVGGIALAAALACVGTAHAADDALFTTTAQLSNLSYRLIDLDPNDGVAPSASFDNFSVVLGLPWNDGVPRYSGSLLPTSTLQADVTNGLFQATPSALTASTSITSGDLASQISQTTTGYQSVNVGSSEPYFYSAGSDVDNPYFGTVKLSPNTAIVITGVASVTSSTNSTKLVELINTLKQPGVNNPYVDLTSTVTPNVYLSLSNEESDADFGGFAQSSTDSHFSLNGRRDNYITLTDGYYFDPMPDIEKQSNFSILYANLGSQDKAVRLDVSVGASVNLNGYVDLSSGVVTPPIPETPTIPEPSTYALMALGLVGIGLVRRKAAR